MVGADGPMTARAAVHDRLIETLRLEQVAPGEEDDPLAFAKVAVDAVFALDDLLEPLAVEVTFACADPISGYPVAAPAPALRDRLLQRDDLPAGVVPRPIYADSQRLGTTQLGATALLDLLRRGLDQHCPDDGPATGLFPTWHELSVTAAAVRLPSALQEELSEATSLGLTDGAGMLALPILRRNDHLWVAGPSPPESLYAPLELRVRNEAGLLTFVLSRSWSVWSGDGPGGQDVRRVADRLVATGWSTSPEA